MDVLNSEILKFRLKKLKKIIDLRNLNVNRYRKFLRNNHYVKLPFDQKNHRAVIIHNLADTIKTVQLKGELIKDWNNNTFADSIKLITINVTKNIQEEIGRNIQGIITKNGNYD